VQKVTGNTEVMPLWADFASLDSVYEAVERFRRQFERVDVLINNCDIDPRNGREVHALTHDGYGPPRLTKASPSLHACQNRKRMFSC
jgi:NAD(P)-dependent dehydrogenase (short-subunit alcohol dehydrogenase family)